MDEQRSIIKEFFRLTSMSFTIAILAMSLIGWIFGDTAQEASAAFQLGADGLPLQTIFGVLLLAALNSAISVFITTAKIFDKLMLLWKMIITMFSCLMASSIMVAALRWIQRDSLEAWLWFIISFVASFTIVATIMVVKIKLEEKKYNNLLSNYKKEHGGND